jgi:alkanesulfonate monooxygenase SsuD/methylene tetrahydromethanopterin reductase-like flavin-dependent oxidoreductase (luciferase family)
VVAREAAVVEFIANLMSCDQDPAAWARRRESEGWHVLGCADHFWSSTRAFPHLWVTLATMAAATERVMLTSSFANNLFRSPVEFAAAALQLQAVSGGRFEAGLGAGWSRDEVEGSGLGYPDGPTRAARYREAVVIARELLRTNRCTFAGEHYTVNVPALGPVPNCGPPPLVVALGGERTIREIAPLADRVEVKLIASATRNGALDIERMAAIQPSRVHELVAKVRAVNPTVPLSVFVLCSVGADARTRSVEKALGGSFLGGFFGSPDKVGSNIRALETAGISRAQISPFTEDSFELLVPSLM